MQVLICISESEILAHRVPKVKLSQCLMKGKLIQGFFLMLIYLYLSKNCSGYRLKVREQSFRLILIGSWNRFEAVALSCSHF